MRKIILLLAIFLGFIPPAFPFAHHAVKNILIVVAMAEEAAPIIKLLNLSPVPNPDPKLPVKAYVGNYHHLKVALVLNGKDPRYGVDNVGTQAATLTTYVGIKHFYPDIVMSVGTAGSPAGKGAKPGDIYVSHKIYFYSRRLHTPEYQRYGVGGYQSLDTTLLVKKLNIKSGIVCSGDSFDEDRTDSTMMRKYDCTVIDMEAAGVNWVTMLMKIPMFALKGITNYIGQATAHEEFEKNYVTVTNNLALKTQEALAYFSDHT